MKNPSLRSKPRQEPADVIPLKQEPSLLDWLQETNRLIPRETKEVEAIDDDEEISELMEVDDSDDDEADLIDE